MGRRRRNERIRSRGREGVEGGREEGGGRWERRSLKSRYGEEKDVQVEEEKIGKKGGGDEGEKSED